MHTRSREEGLRTVVLSLEQCDDLDTTSVETLSELRQKLHTNGQRLLLARVKDRPRTALKRLKNKWLEVTFIEGGKTRISKIKDGASLQCKF